ncbi:MAG: GNAT family N-acetyltransferase [Gammaproteobacteria bacterium]|nr:GNAT family N-acetyltransferase [Gammaproteobacteria bacterium]
MISSKDEWDAALLSVAQRDFYHSFDFHSLEAEKLQAVPRLFHFQDAHCNILLPLLIRPIGDGQSQLMDATSVYGYGGPLLAGQCSNSHSFQSELTDALRCVGVVSVFSRLHPLIDNDAILAGLGSVADAGQTVSIDLGQSDDEQWSGYRKNLRRDVMALRNSDVHCESTDNSDDIREFASLYNETMRRRGAASDYFYDEAYIRRLLAADNFDMHLFKCSYQGQMVCAGLFSYCEGIVQYHLSGTHSDFYHLAAMKLLLDHVRAWATQTGAMTFHLGGGVGGKDDNLFRFKKGFAKNVHRFRVWRWVLNKTVYNELCQQRDTVQPGSDNVTRDGDFFPYYRAPICEAVHTP